MKKTKKRVLGFSGLFLVAAITTFAALMPSTQTSAVEGQQSVTDEVTVRVVGDVPRVGFVEPENGTRFTKPEQQVSIDYENVTNVKVEIEYTGADGVGHTYTLDQFNANYYPGSKTYELNFDADQRFGYGDYVVHVTGTGYGVDNATEDVIEFSYHVFAPDLPGGKNGPGSSEDNPLTGNPVIQFGVNPDDPYIDRLEVNVYDEDGNLVEELSPQEVYSPYDDLELQFEEHGLPSGWYTVEIQAYDKEGEPYGDMVSLHFYYKAPELPVPNTGAPFMNLNISQRDYLITGVVIFGIAAVIGAVIVARKKATVKRKK